MPVSNKPAVPARRATLSAKPSVPAGWRHTSAAGLRMMLYPHSALSDFILGNGTEHHWSILSFRLHLARAIAEMYAPHEEEALGTLDCAINYILIAQDIHAQTGVWGLTRMGQLVVGEGLHYADDLQIATTRIQQRAAGVKLIRDSLKNLRRLGMTREHANDWLALK